MHSPSKQWIKKSTFGLSLNCSVNLRWTLLNAHENIYLLLMYWLKPQHGWGLGRWDGSTLCPLGLVLPCLSLERAKWRLRAYSVNSLPKGFERILTCSLVGHKRFPSFPYNPHQTEKGLRERRWNSDEFASLFAWTIRFGTSSGRSLHNLS